MVPNGTVPVLIIDGSRSVATIGTGVNAGAQATEFPRQFGGHPPGPLMALVTSGDPVRALVSPRLKANHPILVHVGAGRTSCSGEALRSGGGSIQPRSRAMSNEAFQPKVWPAGNQIPSSCHFCYVVKQFAGPIQRGLDLAGSDPGPAAPGTASGNRHSHRTWLGWVGGRLCSPRGVTKGALIVVPAFPRRVAKGLPTN
jgi:hypothetical protein